MTMKNGKTLQHIAAVAVVLLTFCLVFAAPVAANAEEENAEDTPAFAFAGSDEFTNSTFAEAITAAESMTWAVITLNDNVAISSTLTFTGSNLTIDGNGKKIFVSSDFSENTNFLTIQSDTTNNVTIKDVTIENGEKAKGIYLYNNGKTTPIKFINVVVNASYGSGITVGGATLVLENVKITNSGWNQSIDADQGKSNSVISTLTMDELTFGQLGDIVKISDEHRNAVVNVGTVTKDPTHNVTDDVMVDGKNKARNAWVANDKLEDFYDLFSLTVSVKSDGEDVIKVYQTLENAVNELKEKDTVTLLDNIEVSSQVEITKNKITLVGDDNTITFSSGIVSESTMRISGENFNMTGVTLNDIRTKDGALSVLFIEGKGANINGNIIKAGESTAHRSTGIVVENLAEKTVLNGNEIYLGKAAYAGTDKQRNESVGIRAYSGTTSNQSTNDKLKNLQITGNKIFKNESADASNLQVGILIDGAQEGDSMTVTGNTFSLGDGIILEVMTNGTDVATPTLDLTFKGNTVTAGTFLYLVMDYWNQNAFTLTLNGEINNDMSVGSFWSKATEESLNAGKIITGGTYSFNPSAYIAPGMEVVQPGNSYLVQKYVDRSSSSSSSVKPEEPEQPEEPVVEPETPAAPGEVAASTEVTDGGEVTFETPAGEDGTAPAPADDEVKGVVLPTGTEGTVEFVPVSETPAPAGQEENTKRVFEINVPSYKKGEASVIKFQMTVAEIEADGKTAADVALWHYDEETGEWTKLVTSFIIKDGIVYFEAITNDFSPFAIVYADEPAADLPTDTPETPEQPEDPASPAPVLVVLAALGAAVVLRRK